MANLERPDWMTSISANVDPKDYLLGRKIDKTFKLSLQERKKKHDDARTALFASDKLKLSSDPMLALERKRMELRIEILSNPVKLKQLREQLLKEEKEKIDFDAANSQVSQFTTHENLAKPYDERNSNHKRKNFPSNRSPSSTSSSSSLSSSSSSSSHSSSSSSSLDSTPSLALRRSGQSQTPSPPRKRHSRKSSPERIKHHRTPSPGRRKHYQVPSPRRRKQSETPIPRRRRQYPSLSSTGRKHSRIPSFRRKRQSETPSPRRRRQSETPSPRRRRQSETPSPRRKTRHMTLSTSRRRQSERPISHKRRKNNKRM